MDFAELVQQKSINLSRNDLEDDDLDVLTKVLRESKVLEGLMLRDNRITLADGKFTDALAENRTLGTLEIGSNKIGIEGAKRLADALKRNNTLQYINLSGNQIDDEGAKSLAAAVVVSKTLKYVGLGSNKIGDVGAKSLAASLLINGSLEKIDLAENNITDEGGKSLAYALRCNRNVEWLNLGENGISHEIMTGIKAGILADPNECRVCGEDPRRVGGEGGAMTLQSPKRVPSIPRRPLGGALKGVLQSFMVEKDEENARLKKEIRSRDEELASKDKEIASLTGIIDLSGGKNETSTKRPREEESNLATIQRKNQKIVRVKQEKEATEADLEDVREDLDIEKETVEHQLRATDVWQSRFDEIANLAKDGPVDTAMIVEIRSRSLAGGS